MGAVADLTWTTCLKMYEYDSGTVLVTFTPPKLYQAKGVDAEVQAEDLFIPPTSLN